MHGEYWHERWKTGQISFHQPEVETHLREHLGRLGLARGETVLVPLCGKSVDMLWLAAQGYPVAGVELSGLACESFFSENRLAAAEPVTEGRFRVHRAKEHPITLFEGDFFDLSAAHTGPLAAFYDRAALIALPPALRERYVQHLKSELLGPGSRGLVISVAYEQSTFPGPPFSIPPEEVQRLWGDRFHLELLGRGEEQVGPPTQRITTAESAWLLTPKEHP
jgi:thiopurine S-methyltransferase